ncbi:MAG: WXG100 family type VII secretion target [Ruminococcus sp.]|nr:WXG100 family type VII secretion target [Ruminococcus sp.]
MADIIFRYPEMRKAASDISALAARYQTAATSFESDFLGAIGGWEGDSKEKMSAFISGPVMEYMGTTVPELLNALSQILEENAKQMESADTQIAENIPSSLG